MCLAIPGKLLSYSGEAELRIGKVSFGGIVKQVNLAYVPEAKVDDYVLVHVGFALTVIDEAEAAQTFEYLKQMDELGELGELRPDPPEAGDAPIMTDSAATAEAPVADLAKGGVE
jgi:hydrogenase expression/formation protein HypC